MAENILIADDNELPPPANNKVVLAADDELPPPVGEKKKPSPNGGTPLQPGTKGTSLSKSGSQSVSVNPKNNPIPLTKSGSISGVPDFSGIVKDAVAPKVNPSNKALPGVGKSLISETPELSAPKIQSDNLNPQPSDLAQAQISGLKSREELDADKNSLQLADYLEKSGKSLKDFDPVDFKKHINTINGETEETPFIGKAMAAYKSDLDAYGKAGAIINRNIDVAKADIDSKLGHGTFGKYQKLMQDYQSQFKFKEPLIKKIDGDISTITQQLTDLQQKAKSAKNPVEYGQIKQQYGALYSQAEQLQKQRDEAAGPLTQMEQELKQFSSTPEFQKLNDLYSAQQTLSQKQESLLDKHPDAKQTLQRWEDVQKFTDGVIRQQKLVNPAGAMALTLGGDVLKTITKTAKNLSAIPSIVEKATGTEGLVKHSPLVIFDAVTDAIHDVSAAADNEVNNLTPSNMNLPVSQHYKIVDGNKIFVDKNGNALFARDIDGYKLGDSAEKKAIEKYNATPEAKSQPTVDKVDAGVLINEAVKFGLDIAGPLKGIGTGLTELGLAGSAAKGYANGTLTLMGYGLNDAYESAKQSAPNLTDQQASQYALGSQAAIGLMFSMLGGAKMKYITGDGENIFAKIRSAISKEKGLKLDANDIKAIDGGLSPYQVGQRKVLALMKESLLQGGEMGVIMPTANALMNGVTNKLVGYKALGTDIDLKESFVNGGAPAMLVGAVTGFSGVNRSSIKNEAWSKITKDDATAKATLNFINQSTEDGLYTQEQADRLKQRISYTVKNLEPFAGTLDESSKKILANLYDHKFQLTEKAMSLTDDAAKKAIESQIKDIDNDIAETIKGNQDNLKSQIAVGIRDGISSMAETENRGKEIPNENSLTKDAEPIKNETNSDVVAEQELNNSSRVPEGNGDSGEVQQGSGETAMSNQADAVQQESKAVDNPALKDVESTAKALEGVKFNANFNLPLEQTKSPKQVSEAYHKAKADGTNPELVKAVEDLLAKTPTQYTEAATPPKKETSGVSGSALKDVESDVVQNSEYKGVTGTTSVTVKEKDGIIKATFKGTRSDKPGATIGASGYRYGGRAVKETLSDFEKDYGVKVDEIIDGVEIAEITVLEERAEVNPRQGVGTGQSVTLRIRDVDGNIINDVNILVNKRKFTEQSKAPTQYTEAAAKPTVSSENPALSENEKVNRLVFDRESGKPLDGADEAMAEQLIEKAISKSKDTDQANAKLDQLGYNLRGQANADFNQFVQDRIDGKTDMTFSEWKNKNKSKTEAATPKDDSAIQSGGEQKLPDQKEVPIEQKQEVSDDKLSRLPKKKKDANIETPKPVDEPIQQAIDKSKEQGVKEAVQQGADGTGQGNAEGKPADVESEKRFTEAKDLNRMFADLKSKHGDKKGTAIYQAADRLVNPNTNTIVEIRSNGVVVKEGDKYIMKPFGNTDANSKNWTLYKGIDVTDQYAPKEQPISKTETTENLALKDVESTAKALESVELPSKFVAQDKGGILNRENYYRLAQEKFQESEGLTTEEIFDKNKQKEEFKTQKGRDAFQKKFEQFAENPINKKQIISEAYHKAKADGSNPELVKAVEEALSNKQITNEEQPTNADITGQTTDAEPVITTDETGQKSEETKSTEESGEGQRKDGESGGETREKNGDVLGISKKRIFDKFGKKFEKTRIGWNEIAKRTLDTLSEIAHGKNTTPEKEAEHQVNQMHDDIVSGKPIEVSDHKIVTTAAHIMDLEQRMDDLAGEKGGNITDNGILAEELLKQRDKALFVLDKLGSQSGRNLGIFSGVFSKLDDGGIAINRVKIEGKLGYKLPATKEELKDSDLTETQKAEALKYMNELADVKKKYEEAKKRYEETEKRLTEEQVAAKIKEAFEKGKKAGTVKKVTLSKEKIEKTKAELGQAVQDFMQAFGGISMAEGNIMPSVTKSLKQIGVKLMELGYATAENVFDKVVEYITQQTGKKPDIEHYRPEFEKKAKLKIPNKLIKEAVENGATTIDAVVNEIQKQFPDELPRTIRDAISGYGETTKPSDDPVDTQVRKIKRMGRYMSALEDIENDIRPLKTGPQRDTLEADELAELAKIRVGLSKMPIDAAEAENQLKTAQEALEKRLENSIAELNRQIETGERPEKAKATVSTPNIEKLREEKKRLLKIRDSIDNPPKSDLEKLIDRAIDVTNNINKAKKEGNKKDEKALQIEKEATDGAITNLIDKVIELNTDKSQVELARKIKAKQNDIDKLKTKLDNNDLSADKKEGITSPELKELEEERKKLLDELSNRRIAQNRATALDKIKGISENENATTITKSMVDNGHISDIMDDIIQKGAAEEEVADKMFDALKSVLPDVTRQQMNDAITGNGEFKKESKQAVKTEIQTKTQRVKQIANLETKLEALKAANDYHAESDKNKKKQIKSDYEKSLQKQIADLRKQRSTAAKVDEINAEIKRLQDGGEIFKKATGNKTQASEELVNARKKLKDLYNEKGLKRETGSKDTVAAKNLVLDNLSDNLKSHQDTLTDRANEATNNGDTDTAAKINAVKKQISDIQNLLDKNPGADLKEKIDKAYHALDDLKVKDKDLKKEIDDIKDNFQKDWQKSADELSKQRITKQYQTEINTAKRKMAANHVSEIPTTKFDVSKDSNLTDFQRENKRIKGQLNQMVQRAAEKNKTFGDKVLDWRRSLMTGTIHTLERVAISGVSKIIFDPLVNQTAGRLTAMMPGMKDTSIPLKATAEGYKSWFKFRNQAAAEAHIAKSEKSYNDAIDNFEKAKGTPQEKDALKKLHEAEYNHAQAQLYKFIYTNLLFDTKDIMLHDATPFDEYAGKGLRQNFSDLHGKDEKLLYIINSLNRMHLVVKNPSARRSFVESYTANLMKMQNENVPLDANARMRAMDMAMLQYEQGKYSNETWFTKTLSKVRNINAPMRYFIKYAIPVARVSTNILKYGVDMTPIGISEASVRYFKGAADGMKLNAEEGKEFNTAMDKFRQGVNRIPKEDKEYIARVMSRGLFGAALMLAALSMYKNGDLKYGGEFDEKRRKPRKGTHGTLEHGQWEIYGHKIGKFGSGVLNHLPEFIAVAMAVNTADVYTEEKEDDKDAYDALSETLRSDVNEIYERLPIPNKVIDNIFTLPPIPIVSDIDKWTDVDEDGELRGRKAKTAWEKSEMNIGLRRKVPEKEGKH